jgi:hypothetical protein
LALSVQNVKKACAELKSLLESRNVENDELRKAAEEFIEKAAQVEN